MCNSVVPGASTTLCTGHFTAQYIITISRYVYGEIISHGVHFICASPSSSTLLYPTLIPSSKQPPSSLQTMTLMLPYFALPPTKFNPASASLVQLFSLISLLTLPRFATLNPPVCPLSSS